MSESACPEHVLACIAWYPDGLSPEERGAVEAHAADCRACREELAFLRGDEEPEVEIPDPARVYERVLERIEAHEEGVEASEAPGREAGRARPARRAPRRGVRPAALVAGLAAALLAGGLGGAGAVLLTRGGSVYRTAVAPPAVSAGGAELDVVFRADATAEQMRRSLRAVGAEVISGPSPLGVYRVRLAPGADPAAVSQALEGEGEGVATFAQPAAG